MVLPAQAMLRATARAHAHTVFMDAASELLSLLHRRVLVLERGVALLAARCGDVELAGALVALAGDINDDEAMSVLFTMARKARGG